MGITACDAVKVKSDLRLMAQELWSSVKTLLEAPQTWLKILIFKTEKRLTVPYEIQSTTQTLLCGCL